MSAASVERGHHVAHHVLNVNSLTPWLQARLDVDGPKLTIDLPRAFLGIVPLGRRRTDLDLGDVAGFGLGWRPCPGRLVVAALLAWAMVGLDPPVVVAVLLGAMAVWLAILSFIAVLRIHLREAGSIVIPICMLQRGQARRVADRIAWIADRTR